MDDHSSSGILEALFDLSIDFVLEEIVKEDRIRAGKSVVRNVAYIFESTQTDSSSFTSSSYELLHITERL